MEFALADILKLSKIIPGVFVMKRNLAPLAALILMGCGTTYSDHESLFDDTPIEKTYDDNKILGALDEARLDVKKGIAASLQDMKKYRRYQTAFDSSTIMLATGTVAAAVFGGPVGLIGGFGLSGSTLGTYRDYYNPEGIGASHIKARVALECVYNESEILTRAKPEGLVDQISQLDQALSSTQVAASALKPNTPAGAIDASQKAIDAGTAAKEAVLTEIEAIRRSPGVIWTALTVAMQYVDTKEHRKSVNIGDAGKSISTGIDFATTSASSMAEARTKLDAAKTSTAQEQGRTSDKKVAPDPAPIPPGGTPPAIIQNAPPPVARTPKEAAAIAEAAVYQNVETAAGLVSLTQRILSAIPRPAYSGVNAKISGCVAGLQS